jgi:hypothetical protein
MKFRGGRDWGLRQFEGRGPVIDRRGTFNEGRNVIDRCDPPCGLYRNAKGCCRTLRISVVASL